MSINGFEWIESWNFKIENIIKSVLYRFLLKIPDVKNRNILFKDDYEWFSNEDLLKDLIDILSNRHIDKFDEFLFWISDIFNNHWLDLMSKSFLQQDYSARELFEDMCFLLAENPTKFNYIWLAVTDYRDEVDSKLK